MASSLDGKIGPANVDQFVAIGSKHDLQHLITLRDGADAVFFGANTFRTWPKPHRGNSPNHHPHHFILSRSLDLDPTSELFQHPEYPLTIFTPSSIVKPFPDHVRLVEVPASAETIPFILEKIQSAGVESLLVEGGGLTLSQMIEAKALQELYLTVVPKIIGQADAPELLGGETFTSKFDLEVLDTQLVGSETYFHLKFNYL